MDKKLKRLLNVDNTSNILSSITAIVIGLLAGLVVLLFSSPANALGGFGAILTGGLANRVGIGQTLYLATPIMMTGLSVAFANRTGLFNIGASGQFTAGAFAAIFVGVHGTFLPGALHWIVALLAATAAGAIWGSAPGFLKAYRNVNEVISCIMMNYISVYLVNFLIVETQTVNTLTNQTKRVAASAVLPKLGLDILFKDGAIVSSANGGIFIALLMSVIVYIVLEKTKFGFELKACGFNREAACYAGVDERRSIMLSMLIAGAASGLGGGLLYLAGSGNGIDVVDVLTSYGFDGIPVALLALNNPIAVIFSSLFIGYLKVGGTNMQLFNFAPQVIEIIVAIIIYFSAFALILKGLFTQLTNRRRIVPKRKFSETEVFQNGSFPKGGA
ncbi:MAG: ABC transporter permease [Clostridiales bacterium]|nr:ABC transporter permease [Clostridiales bacterium]